MTDLTRKNGFSQKKGVSVAAARVTHDMVDSTALNELFNLPENAVITNAMVAIEIAGQNNLEVDFGFEGGDELGDGLEMDAVAGTVQSTALDISDLTLTEGTPNTYLAGGAKLVLIHTGTGKSVTAKFSAAPTVGSFVFIVEFIEYDLANGALMNVTRA